MSRFKNSYLIDHKGKCFTVTSSDLDSFSRAFVTDEKVRSRCSERFLLDLYVYAETDGLNPAVVIEEITNLDANSEQSRTKPASVFSRLPLKGLWHKHFFSSHFIAKNMQIANGKGNIEAIVEQVFKNYEGMDKTVDNCFAVAKEIAAGNQRLFDNRAGNDQLTGEWIVFAKVDNLNYYLCLEFHGSDDQTIYDKVIAACKNDFEELVPIIESYA